MDWDNLKIFLAVVKAGSVRKGAKYLQMHHSSVVRRIENFEKQIGTKLFNRTPGGYVPTPIGESLIAKAEKIENEVFEIERTILGGDARLTGELRISMPYGFATHLLMKDLVAFANKYPDIELELIVSYELLNLSKREADVAIRACLQSPEHLVGQRVVQYATCAYATPEYLKNKDLNHPASGCCWIGWGDRITHPEWVRNSNYPHLPAKGRFNSEIVQLAAAKAGMGIAMMPCYLGDSESSLSRVPPGIPQPNRDIWLLTHKDLLETARVKVFMDFMSQALARKKDLLEGHCPFGI